MFYSLLLLVQFVHCTIGVFIKGKLEPEIFWLLRSYNCFVLYQRFLCLLGKIQVQYTFFFNSILLYNFLIYWQEINSLLSSTGWLCFNYLVTVNFNNKKRVDYYIACGTSHTYYHKIAQNLPKFLVHLWLAYVYWQFFKRSLNLKVYYSLFCQQQTILILQNICTV